MADHEQQVRECFERFASAWDDHDIAAMVACWAEDGNAIDPWGRFAAGHEGIARLLSSEHASSMRDSRYRIDALRVRSLSEHSAIVECDAVIQHVLAPNGSTYDLPHRIDAVVVHQNGWRLLSLHPTFARA